MYNFSKSSQLKLFGFCGLMTKAQMKINIVYGTARTDDSLIVAMRKSQSVPFQGRQDCRLGTICANETQRNIWVRAHGIQMLRSHPIQ
jgi:hypothetical protein